MKLPVSLVPRSVGQSWNQPGKKNTEEKRRISSSTPANRCREDRMRLRVSRWFIARFGLSSPSPHINSTHGTRLPLSQASNRFSVSNSHYCAFAPSVWGCGNGMWMCGMVGRRRRRRRRRCRFPPSSSHTVQLCNFNNRFRGSMSWMHRSQTQLEKFSESHQHLCNHRRKGWLCSEGEYGAGKCTKY